MNLNDLERLLLKNDKIPDDSYSLVGGLPNESLCIASNSGKWEVYYSERGKKSDIKAFKTETQACQYFYERLKEMLGLK